MAHTSGFLQMLPVLWHRQLHLGAIQTNPQTSIDLGFTLLSVDGDSGQSVECVPQKGKWLKMFRCMHGTDKPLSSLK